MKSGELTNTIKFGIMCKFPILKYWQAECIEQIFKVENVKLVLLIHPTQKTKRKKRNLLQQLAIRGDFSRILFHLYQKLLLRPKCYSQVNFSDKFKAIPSIYCATRKINHSEYFVKDDVEKIKKANLDFIILFSGFSNIRGKILNSPKYGVWSYHHGDIYKYRGSPVCFWEIYNDDNATGVILQKLTSRYNAIVVLKKGFFKTLKYSYSKNLESVYSQSSIFVKEVCTDLMNYSSDYINNLPTISTSPIYQTPNNLEFINFFLKLIKTNVIKIFMNLFMYEQWNIGYIESSIYDFLDGEKKLKINWLLSPSKNEFFADPFIIRSNNTLYILFENFRYKDNKGSISVINIDCKDKKREIKKSMDKAYHIAYPFVFKYNDEIYLIPNERETNEIALYKAIKFPSTWEKVKVLIENITASDSTLFKYNDLWWLTCSLRDGGNNLRLYIYYSDDLFGPWQPHKKNPVKTDVRSSRPAGKIIRYKGSLLRPSQDNSKTYGGRIVLNRIIQLTPQEFEEEPFKIIDPNFKDKYNKGIHTLNSIDNIIILDGKRDVFSLNKFKKTIRIIMKKILNFK